MIKVVFFRLFLLRLISKRALRRCGGACDGKAERFGGLYMTHASLPKMNQVDAV